MLAEHGTSTLNSINTVTHSNGTFTYAFGYEDYNYYVTNTYYTNRWSGWAALEHQMAPEMVPEMALVAALVAALPCVTTPALGPQMDSATMAE